MDRHTKLTVWDEIDILIRRFRKLPVMETLLISRDFLSQAAWLLVADALEIDPYGGSRGACLYDLAENSEAAIVARLCVARDSAKHPSKATEYEVVRYVKLAWEGLASLQGADRKTRKHCAHLVRTISDRFGSSLPSDEPLRVRKAKRRSSARFAKLRISPRVSPT
jgi:hypothetical protein